MSIIMILVVRELELRDILEVLFKFTTVQERMIQRDASLARQAGRQPSLQKKCSGPFKYFAYRTLRTGIGVVPVRR